MLASHLGWEECAQCAVPKQHFLCAAGTAQACCISPAEGSSQCWKPVPICLGDQGVSSIPQGWLCLREHEGWPDTAGAPHCPKAFLHIQSFLSSLCQRWLCRNLLCGHCLCTHSGGLPDLPHVTRLPPFSRQGSATARAEQSHLQALSEDEERPENACVNTQAHTAQQCAANTHHGHRCWDKACAKAVFMQYTRGAHSSHVSHLILAFLHHLLETTATTSHARNQLK